MTLPTIAARAWTRIVLAGAAAITASLALAPPALAGSASPAASVPAPPYPSNGLAKTPPMGWNDWYQYRCTVSETKVLANAQAIVDSGLAQLGYRYINLDDCWMASARAADGTLQADPTRFPHGIAWLAGQLHAMGLKLGIYEAIGTTTCQGLPGSSSHSTQDANTFASWGVDYVKFDYCGVSSTLSSAALESDFNLMSTALRNTGRPIVYSEELPIAAGDADPSNANYLPYVSYSAQIANMWRVAPDEKTTDGFAATVFGHLNDDLPLNSYAHPGAWNDLDMLLTGNTAFNWTATQQQTQMSIWAVMASPLIVSGDMTAMSDSTKAILGNSAVIAVQQDSAGKQGTLAGQQGTADIVSKPLANGDIALLLANSGSAAQSVTVDLSTLGMRRAASYTVRDLWANTTQSTAASITESVPAQGAVLLRVTPVPPTLTSAG